jgi:signal peptidase I
VDFDFSFFLVVATFVSGGIVLFYKFFGKTEPVSSETEKEPLLLDYARSFFPVVLVVLLLRSFLVEPFRIPSSSMMPSLLIGDFILVSKYAYGVRLPVVHTKVIEVGQPERGDAIVFRYPKAPDVDYIKRVVGIPGDRISYYKKQVFLNGNPVDQVSLGPYVGVGQGAKMTGAEHLVESFGERDHEILLQPKSSNTEGVWVVPKGHYFVMGDNRDNSNDSRYWGFVPEQNLVGKAFYIWMNWDWEHKGIGLERIGTVLE